MVFRLPLFLLLALGGPAAYAAVPVVLPMSPSSTNVVNANFLGISFELAFMSRYFGNDTNQIPTPMLNYLSNIRLRTGANTPVRMRIGGNSADISPYSSTSTSPMVQLIPGNFSSDYQPASYNSMMWSVMASVSESVGGAAYIINVPLGIPVNASLSNDLRTILGSSLDAMLLGNEPDLYTEDGKRPNLKNYTTTAYAEDYVNAINIIGANDAAGNKDIGGPSLCCFWDLETLLREGYLTQFSADLKYIVIQHYPQNNCKPGVYPFQLPWYNQHANVVTLTKWQLPGIEYLLQQPAENRPLLVNSEFNSAACGGVPFSPSFGVGALWSIDYSLQMASVGYAQAYIHTREAGPTYNLLTPPAGPAGTSGAWTTNSPYYALLTMAEALRSDAGSIVQDLNLGGSSINPNVTTAGYAIYAASNKTVSRLVLFNFANSSTQFTLPASVFPSSGTALVKFLAAATPEEETNISWGGQTWGPGVSDGKSAVSPAWAAPNQNLTGCASSGCTFTAPGPSMAMVFLDNAQYEVFGVPGENTDASAGGGSGGTQGQGSKVAGASGAASVGVNVFSVLCAVVLSYFVIVV